MHDPFTEVRMIFFELTGEHMSSVAESTARSLLFGLGKDALTAAMAATWDAPLYKNYSIMDGLQAHDRAVQRMEAARA